MLVNNVLLYVNSLYLIDSDGLSNQGLVCCSGRTVTSTVLKRKEEIADIKRQYSNETTHMAKNLDGLQGLVRCLLKQANPDLDDEALDTIMENAMNDNNGASTSTHMHDLDKVIFVTYRKVYDLDAVSYMLIVR
jgi:hypothetical protein